MPPAAHAAEPLAEPLSEPEPASRAEAGGARPAPPAEALLSPSIDRQGENAPAFELKFLVPEEVAREIERWAQERLDRDPFADPAQDGAYQTTTLYLDTPQLDVFHRAPGYRGRKFRVRRYGEALTAYLERKIRRGDRVKKKRSALPLAELSHFPCDGAPADWSGHWFRTPVQERSLLPTCRITYCRTAFIKLTAAGLLRLTLDRAIRGARAEGWSLAPVDGGHGILPGEVICELKFREALPAPFRELIAALRLTPGSVSKYRRVLAAAGGANGASGHA